jgi:hypothetical protein
MGKQDGGEGREAGLGVTSLIDLIDRWHSTLVARHVNRPMPSLATVPVVAEIRRDVYRASGCRTPIAQPTFRRSPNHPGVAVCACS